MVVMIVIHPAKIPRITGLMNGNLFSVIIFMVENTISEATKRNVHTFKNVILLIFFLLIVGKEGLISPSTFFSFP